MHKLICDKLPDLEIASKRIQCKIIIPFAIFGFVIYAILAPSLGKLRFPVLIYIVVILIMAWLAWERWSQTSQSWALLASLGAVLFLISDTILAINRFR